MCLAQERIYFHGRRGGSPCNHSRERASAFFPDLAGMDIWHLSRLRSGRRRLLPCRHDSLVRHFHWAFGRRRSNLQRGKRQSCRNQNEARKHSSTRRTVRYDRRWQIGHCCGSIGTDRTSVWIQVDCRRRLVACSADPDSRLRADHRESERVVCLTEPSGSCPSGIRDAPINSTSATPSWPPSKRARRNFSGNISIIFKSTSSLYFAIDSSRT